MRKAGNYLILAAMSLVVFIAGCYEPTAPEPELDGNQGDYGKPYPIYIHPLPPSQTEVAFGLIGDTHIDASYAGAVPHWVGHWYDKHIVWDHCYRETPHVKRNRHTIYSLNIHLGNTPNCHGIVHVGDMVNANNTQNLVAFRQFYECSYPGHDGGAIAGEPDSHYQAYSQGARVNKTVFPTVGNHDSPFWSQGSHDWHEPASYIHDLIEGASGIAGYYDYLRSGAYAWRWGQYYFIQLGLWAGSGQAESAHYVDLAKLQWLADFLEEHVGDSGLGVLIFQHYGWDSMSTDGRWWQSGMRDMELDVLCRRDWNDTLPQPARPYNVLGIFTGHVHNVQHIRVFAGLNAEGDSVHFDNITVDDAGADTNYGYSIVELLGDEMKISTMHISHGPHYEWTYWSKPYQLGPQVDSRM